MSEALPDRIWIRQLAGARRPEGFWQDIKNAFVECEQLEYHRAPTWISVEDRLPEEDTLCWVYYGDVDQDWFVDGAFTNDSTGEITYWQPALTPAPPGELMG